MDLNQREQEVLAAIVREYILSGEPVASRTLVCRQGIHNSPATIRAVMADLEDQGFLVQPYTSAGRLPTEVGLRFYVDRLMQAKELTQSEKKEILTRYNLSNLELQELLREVSRLLSDLSKRCALILVPRTETAKLKRIEFVSIRQGKMIAVLVMNSGAVINRLIDETQMLLPPDLEKIHYYLNDLCDGKTLSEVRALVEEALTQEKNKYDQFISRALELGAKAVAGAVDDAVVIEGQSKLMDHPLSNDPEQMKLLLKAIDEKKIILKLLDETIHGKGVQIFIGAETKEEEMRTCSLVASAYGGEKPLGTVGVLGPSCMNYPRVVPIVDFTAHILTHLIAGE